MKSAFYLIALYMVLAACTPAANHSPPPIPETPSIRIPNSIFPTPTEPAPVGTVEKTAYLGNRFAATDGALTHWFYLKTNKWERFQPIDFFNPNKWQIIEQEVVYTSGFYEQEIKRAITHRRWQQIGKDVKYVKKGDWYQLTYTRLGDQYLFVDFGTLNTTYDNYPFQPTEFYSVFQDGDKRYFTLSNILHYQTSGGQNMQQPISYKIPIEELDRPGSDFLFKGLEFTSGLSPLGIVPLVDFDPDRVEQTFIEELSLIIPLSQTTQAFHSYYLADKNDPLWPIKQQVLLRLYNGDETALGEIGKFLYSPVIAAIGNEKVP